MPNAPHARHLGVTKRTDPDTELFREWVLENGYPNYRKLEQMRRNVEALADVTEALAGQLERISALLEEEPPTAEEVYGILTKEEACPPESSESAGESPSVTTESREPEAPSPKRSPRRRRGRRGASSGGPASDAT